MQANILRQFRGRKKQKDEKLSLFLLSSSCATLLTSPYENLSSQMVSEEHSMIDALVHIQTSILHHLRFGFHALTSVPA